MGFSYLTRCSAITKRFHPLSSKCHSSLGSSGSLAPFAYATSAAAKSSSLCNGVSGDGSEQKVSKSSYHVSSGDFMRGAVFWEPNKPLTIEEFRMPRPKAGEVLIKNKGCGVCHSDLHVIKGELPFASPCALGHEITGEVVEHGPLTDGKIIERIPVGSRVVGAFIMPCGNCFYCSKGHDDLCEDFFAYNRSKGTLYDDLCEDFFAYNRSKGTLYDGETRLFLRNSGKPVYMYSMGGLSEYCVIPANALTILPNSLPYTESAILGCAVFTAYGAMAHAAGVHPGDSVAVIGIGGVGSSCLQIARAFGASDVIAVDVQDEKLQKAKIFGATHTVNALKEDSVEKIRVCTLSLYLVVTSEIQKFRLS
uniref:Alcohol dehydrogenase class-3 isoform X1 n=1 Tax=Rhizophora mucronata TaxID=61149 RepID=A0A2P2IX99_RHIMU